MNLYEKIPTGKGKVIVMIYQDTKDPNRLLDRKVFNAHDRLSIAAFAEKHKAICVWKRLESLEHHYTFTCGLWAIDADPKEKDVQWIRENTFQII